MINLSKQQSPGSIWRAIELTEGCRACVPKVGTVLLSVKPQEPAKIPEQQFGKHVTTDATNSCWYSSGPSSRIQSTGRECSSGKVKHISNPRNLVSR